MSLKIFRRLIQSALPDGTLYTESNRGTVYAEQTVQCVPNKMSMLADEGSYYATLSPTPGTGIAGHAAPTTMDNTKPFVMIRNNDSVKSIYLDYIKLTETVAGAGGTLNYATHLLDAGGGYTSGGSVLSPVSPNSGAGPTSIAQVYSGAVIATANAALQRIISNQRRRTVIPVAGDVCLFDFGGNVNTSGMPTEGTTELERIFKCPPVVIAPGHVYKLVLWRASQSGADSLEVEIGHWER